LRVCLDTNVLVAAFTTRGLCADVLRIVLAEHELVIGDVILSELRRVLKTKMKIPAEVIDAAMLVFDALEIEPKPKSKSALRIEDEADQWIHSTAIAGKADVLVTGDKELLKATSHSSIPIVSPRQFWEMLRTAD